jgi:putative YhbY family RNA-binding protein
MQKPSPTDRQALRARAHSLHPVVMISEKGLSDSVLKEIDRCLTAHELIKIRVFSGDRGERAALLDDICIKLGAASVQHIGKIFVVHRKNPDPIKPPRTDPKLRAKPASAKKPVMPWRRRASVKPDALSSAFRNKI